MKVIIGINTYHADSSACILVDGKIIAAVEEERINRKKHFSGYPIESIKECLKIANKKDYEITDIAFNTEPKSNLIKKIIFFLLNFSIIKNQSFLRFNKKLNIKHALIKEFKLKKNINFHFIEHHLAHIASAFYPSGFEHSNGLSIDGSGDFVTFAWADCRKNNIKIIKKTYFPNSLGIFYHAMTQFLDFNNYGDEYKVMGLAAYGSPKYFDKIKNKLFIETKHDLFKLNLKYFNHHNKKFRYIAGDKLIIDKIFNCKLTKLFSNELDNAVSKDQFCKDFAASVQKVYEFYFNRILENIHFKNLSENLVFAGGCALNSSANKVLTNNKELFKNLYIPFAPGDNGGALGAAFVVAAKYKNNIQSSKDPYLGREYSLTEIKNILDKKFYKGKINYKLIPDKELFKFTAKLISKGSVIGWFQGRMEFGPRALGNRSILADPRNPEMKNIINMKIKRRESFRPFAPSILEKYQAEWFDSKYINPYMSSVATVKMAKKKLIPAVIHIDNTARLQTVNSDFNKRYNDLIEEFYLLTGVPILLNTSFNENEPIVMKPEESIDCLLRTDMDAVFINNFFVTKI
jgi:carbamoyltransferase